MKINIFIKSSYDGSAKMVDQIEYNLGKGYISHECGMIEHHKCLHKMCEVLCSAAHHVCFNITEVNVHTAEPQLSEFLERSLANYGYSVHEPNTQTKKSI